MRSTERGIVKLVEVKENDEAVDESAFVRFQSDFSDVRDSEKIYPGVLLG